VKEFVPLEKREETKESKIIQVKHLGDVLSGIKLAKD